MPVKKHKIRLWAVAFWLILWEAGSYLISSEIILVSPLKVLLRLSELTVTSSFWISCLNSLLRITLGFILGVALGTILAALSSKYKRCEELFAPLLLAVKTVPVASFIILALILFSSKYLAVLISFLMVMPIVYSNVLEGIREMDKDTLEMAEVFHIPLKRRIRYIYLPLIFPYFKSACTLGIGMSWKSGVAAELIGIPAFSIGEKLHDAKVYFDTPDLFAWTLVIVILSLAFEKLLILLLNQIQKRTEKIS